ncbi:hypothetical protein BU25DRAFT_442229 [Macroventuria anomochaeta]|uniref:Uncharacterized protein n=1 Tax=Macroventuria anomochaeta TaxID=301207 RepID=A0ACB6RPV4_9PLEO|nr:uncharacterized protein BU25DRAFT_442229 [Macroventuria anomochaeta]KAF2623990.1 hypothetical protein BU25DRAFT_442229 [Macroventuria anomochaeta]
METSEYFERTLFYDKSPDANDYYESSAGLVFVGNSTETPVEVRVQSCSKFLQIEKTTRDTNSENRVVISKEEYPDSTESVDRLEYHSDHRPRQADTVHDGCYPFAYKDTKLSPDSAKDITKDPFERLLDSCHVFLRFTDYVTGLCAKTSDSEVGPPPLKFRPLRSINDSMYRGFGQFAVYHRYKPAQNSPCSMWILAGVSQCTEPCLDGYTRSVCDLAGANPFEIHMIFLDTCITNWRPYLAHLTRLVKEQSGRSSGFILSGNQSKNLVTITVEDHQQLKEIEDDVADLVLCLDSTLDTLTSFMRMYEDFRLHRQESQTINEVQKACVSKCNAIVVAFEEKAQEISYNRKKADNLQSKIQNTRKLVSSLLERQSAHNINQQIGALESLEKQGQQENRSMRQFTEKSSRDSSSMRILTIITMVYLPCTIVSNFFSTQFVNQIESDTGAFTLQYAQNTWLFFAISVPLTLFTIFVWFLWKHLCSQGICQPAYNSHWAHGLECRSQG